MLTAVVRSGSATPRNCRWRAYLKCRVDIYMRQVPQVVEPTGQNYRFLPSSDRVRIFQELYKKLI